MGLVRLLGGVSLLALGVMITPSSITLVILLILRRRGISSPAAFVAGRLTAVSLISFSVLIFFRSVDFSSKSTPSLATSSAKLAIGILLLLLALKLALSKSTSDDEGWLQRRLGDIDRFTPLTAGGAGFALVLLSPRCLILTLAAAATILHANVGDPESLIALAVFVVIGSLGVIAPLAVYVASPQKSISLLDSARKWILLHQRVIIMAVLLVLGVFLAVKGTVELLQ